MGVGGWRILQHAHCTVRLLALHSVSQGCSHLESLGHALPGLLNSVTPCNLFWPFSCQRWWFMSIPVWSMWLLSCPLAQPPVMRWWPLHQPWPPNDKYKQCLSTNPQGINRNHCYFKPLRVKIVCFCNNTLRFLTLNSKSCDFKKC